MWKIAEKLCIPTPKTFKPKDLSDLKHVWNEIGNNGKVVIKLINTNSAKRVFCVNSYQDLLRTYPELIEKTIWRLRNILLFKNM